MHPLLVQLYTSGMSSNHPALPRLREIIQKRGERSPIDIVWRPYHNTPGNGTPILCPEEGRESTSGDNISSLDCLSRFAVG